MQVLIETAVVVQNAYSSFILQSVCVRVCFWFVRDWSIGTRCFSGHTLLLSPQGRIAHYSSVCVNLAQGFSCQWDDLLTEGIRRWWGCSFIDWNSIWKSNEVHLLCFSIHTWWSTVRRAQYGKHITVSHYLKTFPGWTRCIFCRDVANDSSNNKSNGCVANRVKAFTIFNTISTHFNLLSGNHVDSNMFNKLFFKSP